MKKLFIFSFLLIFTACNILSQSGWKNIFFNNVSTFTKIIKRDSLNYIGLTSSKFFYKSSNSGNNWNCIPEYSFDSNYSLTNGQFVNSLTGWVIGSSYTYYPGNGVILKTTNGGQSWNRQNTGFNNYYCSSINFLNENTGWVGSSGGSVGYLMKTTNGGLNWSKQDFAGAYNVGFIKFFDISNGWILGTYMISKTTNGGQNWTAITVNNVPYTYTINRNLFAINMNEVWALIGSTINYGSVFSNFLKTTNSGTNWTLMYSYTDSLLSNSKSFWQMNFVNPSTGYSNGEFGFILRTTNSGLNWGRINLHPNFYHYSPAILPISVNEIFAAGRYPGSNNYVPYNYIIKSSSSGDNWQVKHFNYHYNFRNVHFADVNNGLVTSDSGIIFKTTNKGINWNKTFSDKTFQIESISFFDNNLGNAFCYSGKILRTTNYGNNWFEISSPSTVNLRASNFINASTGFVIGDSSILLRSTNSGSLWGKINLPLSDSFKCNDIHFINENTGWILNQRNWGWGYPINIGYRNNKILKTTNSGINWFSIYDTTSTNYSGDSYNLITFFDNNTGWMATGTSFIPSVRFVKTTNGGANWFTYIANLNLNVKDLKMINQNTGWAVGETYLNGNISSAVCKTTNSGINWFLQFTENDSYLRSIILNIHALNTDSAWFCGNMSNVYNTVDGGGSAIGIHPISSQIPDNFSLHQNYPNPFNPVTKIKFAIPLLRGVSEGRGVSTRIIIYDLLGREVTTLVNEQLKPGTYEIEWDGTSYASGVYFYSLVTNEFVETKRMVLIK